MNLLFSVDQNWAIGNQNKLLFHSSGDMARVKELTTGNVIVMGHHTLLSLPKGKPLPNRTNIVLSRKQDLIVEGATVCHDLQELFATLRLFPDDCVFVFGGEQVYRLLLPYCNKAYVTRFDAIAEQADAFLPNLDKENDWIVTEKSEPLYEEGLHYTFYTYSRISAEQQHSGYKKEP